MKSFAIFITLSLAVHAGAVLTLPEGGTQGQGAAGEDTLSLAAASETLASMVEQWERPPAEAPQPVMPQPVIADTITTLTPDTSIQRPTPAPLPHVSPEAAPQITSAPAPALPNPSEAISVMPSVQAPALPGGFAQPNTQTDTRPTTSAPTLTTPDAVTAPQADTRPHFEGSTALATDSSPRPPTRPNDLAPPPPQVAASQPQPQQPRPQTPAPERIATGNGGGETQGAAPQLAPAPAISQAQIQGAMAQWGGQIQSQIARSRPRVSGAGRAVVQLRVGRNGQLQGLGLAQSSGNAAVDQAAVSAVQRAGSFPGAPSVLTNASYSFSLPVSFQ